MKPDIQTRIALIDILSAVLEQHRSLTSVLNEILPTFSDPRDRSLIQFCAYGICRDYFRLEAIIKKLVKKPLKDPKAHYLLLIGLFQLNSSRIPEFAIINSAVDTAKNLKLLSYSGLINGVLRQFQRAKEELLSEVDKIEVAHWDHPAWLLKLLKKAWPEQWQAICAANNQSPPLWLRINVRKISPDAYVELLNRKNMEVSAIEGVACCLMDPVDVNELPGFSEGWVSVQDKSAQYSAELLDLKEGQRVLDACAAPGGKALHILEKENNIAELIALDHDEKRLERIKENAERVQADLSKLILIHGNAECLSESWDGKAFDRILLDAPCSATGVIRRHPDIKLLRQPEDITALAQQQLAILKALWPTLKPQGKLIYATCSILPDENEKLIASFCAQQSDAEILPIEAQWGIPTTHGRQIFPGDNNGDGFFYAVLRKR